MDNITITPEAKGWMANYAIPLKELYHNVGKNMTDTDLAMEIEHRFGTQIVKDVCIPHGLSEGSCLLIAIAVAKEPMEATA